MASKTEMKVELSEQAARWYTAHSCSVLALWGVREGGYCECGDPECASPGKHPNGILCPHGVKDATNDMAVVKKWLGQYPNANIGIATGAISGFWALDIDPRHGGDMSLDILETENGRLPHTVEQETGNRGTHLLFSYTEPVNNTYGKLAPGLDVRGDNGYIVVYPSINSGGPYVWEESSKPFYQDVEIATAPNWLMELIRNIQTSARKNGAAKPIPEKIPEGGRNDALASMAGSMRRRGMGQDAVEAALKAENAEKCDPPLDDKEVEKIAASISRYEPAAPSQNDAKPEEAANPNPPNAPMSMASLLAMDFPPLVFIVMGLLALGHLVVLAGRPKSGKSWLVLQLAKHIDLSAPFLGRETRKARVLITALEDGERRVYQRANILKWRPAGNVDISFWLPKLDGEGGLGPGIAYLRQMAQQYDVIIIDTLISALSGAANENDNVMMASIFNEIARIAHDTNTLILIVHHTGKGSSDDIFHTLRGASAIRGGYDVGLLLERRNDEKEAVLHVESRDFEALSLGLRQVDNGAGWEFVGTAYDIEQIRAGRKTLQAMLDNDPDGEGMTAAQIAKTRGVSEQVIYKQLKALASNGYVYSKEDDSGKGRPLSIWHVEENYKR